MPIYLRLTDGTTTVDLTSGAGTGHVMDYAPGTSERIAGAGITEACQVLLVGGLTTNRATVKSINLLFEAAKRRQASKIGARVFVEAKLSSGLDWSRSEILEASPVIENDTFDQGIRTNAMPITLTWRRSPWWEGPEAYVALTNGNGTSITSGLRLYNCNDGSGTSPAKRNNYADIAAGAVDGDLEAPARIEFSFVEDAGGGRIYDVVMSKNVRSGVSSWTHLIEAESYAWTQVTSSAASGGKYTTVTNTNTTGIFTLSAAQLSAAGGNWFRVLGSHYGVPPSNTDVELKIYNGAVPVVSSGRVRAVETNRLFDLGAIQIPPYFANSGNQIPLDLWINFYNSASVTWTWDYFYVLPLDGWRRVKSNYGVLEGTRFVDDGIEGYTYSDGWPDGKDGTWSKWGSQITLTPGVAQRIVMAFNSLLGITAYGTLRIAYRPRRRSL